MKKHLCFLLAVILLSFPAAFAQMMDLKVMTKKHIINGYDAKVEIDGKLTKFKQKWVKSRKPMKSQYSFRDSLFYLTFELSPLAVTKGEKAVFSGFVVLKGMPEIGKEYPIVTIPQSEDESDPIVEWTPQTGNIVAMQMAYMPLCDNLAGETIDKHRGELILLNDRAITNGTLTFKEIAPYSPGSKDLYISLGFSFDAELTGGEEGKEITRNVSVNAKDVTLWYVQRSDLKPMLFPIDYGWGMKFMPADTYNLKKID